MIMSQDMVARIDEWLGTCAHRELISSVEVADMLLDLRLMAAVGDEIEAPVPVG